jgi:catechol 2,3-dioxygenase-like lactoylglutathione lyase family enzyme
MEEGMGTEFKITLGHGAYFERDFQKAIDFWISNFGFRKKFSLNDIEGQDWLAYVEIVKGEFIEPFVWKEESVVPINGLNSPPLIFRPKLEKNFSHACYIVNDIAGYGRELQRRGVQLYNGPAYLNDRIDGLYEPRPIMDGTMGFYIEDPDGNTIEFLEYTPGCLQLEEPTIDRIDGVKWGLGQLVYQTKNHTACMDFYINKLGFVKKFSLNDESGISWITYLALGQGHFIALAPPADTNISMPDSPVYSLAQKNPGLVYLCLTCDDIVAAGRKLQGNGLMLYKTIDGKPLMDMNTLSPSLCGSLAFFINDVSGNTIQVLQYTEDSLHFREG